MHWNRKQVFNQAYIYAYTFAAVSCGLFLTQPVTVFFLTASPLTGLMLCTVRCNLCTPRRVHTTVRLHVSVYIPHSEVSLWFFAHLLHRFASFLHLFAYNHLLLCLWNGDILLTDLRKELWQIFTQSFLPLKFFMRLLFDCKKCVYPFKRHPLSSTFLHCLSFPFPFRIVYAWSLHVRTEDTCLIY